MQMQKKRLSQLKKIFNFSKIELIEPVFQPDQNLTEDELSVYIDTYVEQSIAYQNQEFEKWKSANIEIPLHSKARAKKRYRMVLLCSFLSFCILIIMLWLGLIPTTAKIYELLTFDCLPHWWFELPPPPEKMPSSPVFFSFITVLASAPVAYAIWMIRDENAAQQIENSRKDTNLKDFQRLSEWASGFHLPEDKVVQSEKTIFKGTEKTVEITSTLENFAPPEAGFSLARRTGAESLQVAAIYQLQSFMYGKYGEQFMIPAFYLIYSIWDQNIKKLIKNIDSEDIVSIKRAIFDYHKQPLARAMNNILTSNHIFHLFSKEIEGLSFTGLIFPENYTFSNLSFKKVDFSHSRIVNSKFINCKLGQVKFQHCSMISINFCSSYFSSCDFENSNISQSNFCNTGISISTFRNCLISSSKFHFSDIYGSKFFNINFRHSTSKNIQLKEVSFDEKTTLFRLKTEDQTPEQIKARWLSSGAKMINA